MTKLTPSERIRASFEESDAPTWANAELTRALAKPATNERLLDLAYSQVEINMKLGNAITQIIGQDSKEAVQQLGAALEQIQSQTEQLTAMLHAILSEAGADQGCGG